MVAARARYVDARREEALEATGQAVDLSQRLAAARPDAFEPHLARSLWASAWARMALQHVDVELIQHAREAVERYEGLYVVRPSAFRDDLAGALDTLAGALDAVGDVAEARDARRRAADVRSS